MFKREWSSELEKAPREKEVLVTYLYRGRRHVTTGQFIGNEFCSVDDEYLVPGAKKERRIIAWMPMPFPYMG